MSCPKYTATCARCAWCQAWTPVADLADVFPNEDEFCVSACPRCVQDFAAERAEEKHVDADWFTP
jgi:hypothetical protein